VFRLLDNMIADFSQKRESFFEFLCGVYSFIKEHFFILLQTFLTLFLLFILSALVYVHIHGIEEYHKLITFTLIISIIIWLIVVIVNFMKEL